MGRARNNTKDFIIHVEGLVRNGGMKEPEWLDIVRRHPPLPVPLRQRKKLPKIVLPQDRLANVFQQSKIYKDLKYDWNTSYQFAKEQIQLIENGMTEKQAFKQLESKYSRGDRNKFLDKYLPIGALSKNKNQMRISDNLFTNNNKNETNQLKITMREEFEKAKKRLDKRRNS